MAFTNETQHLVEQFLNAVCIREVQKSLKESAKRLIEDKLDKHGLGEAHGFRVLKDHIETPGGGVILFMCMQDHMLMDQSSGIFGGIGHPITNYHAQAQRAQAYREEEDIKRNLLLLEDI